jgi:MFS family permease
VLAACFTLNMFGRGLGDTYTVFLIPLERDFGWSRSQTTSVYSVYLLVNGFTAPLVGLIFDRLGPRWVYGAGLACLGSAFYLASTLSNLWQFYVFVGVMVGLGVSLNGMVPGSALLSRWFRERLSTAMGVAYSAFGAGTLLFVPLAQQLIAEYDWRTTYRIMGSALLLLAPIIVLAIPWRTFYDGNPEHRPARGKAGETTGGWTWRAAARTSVYWGLTTVFFFTAAGMFCVVAQLVAFFIDAGFTPLTAATAFGAIGMMSAISVMGSGVLSERFGYRQTVTASFVGTASGMVLLVFMALAPLVWLLVLFVPVFGLCMGMRGPIISSVSAKYFSGRNIATIYGGIYAANAIGAAFGAYVGGVLHDVTGGYKAGFGFSLVCIAIAAMPFWAVRELRIFR